jgi:glycosyltransferase involved in cell wall biosynthesis/GT2 family glycosyltransferase
MECGDLLAPNMLYEIITLLNQQRELDIIYFDEDIVSKNGKQRNSPWFKPTVISPITLLSKNYLDHCFLRRSYFFELGGYDTSLEGAHEWDLAFRAIENSQHIAHIAKVLYHRRQSENITDADEDPLPRTREAQEQCISAHLQRTDPEIRSHRVVHLPNDVIRVHLPVSNEKVSIIIPTKDKKQLLSSCLQSILELTQYPSYEIILVDNGSSDPDTLAYYSELEKEPRVRIIQFTGLFNYSAANNLGATIAEGKYFLLLNNDTQVLTGDWLSELVGWAERPQVAAVGTKLIRPDKTIQHAGIVMGLLGHGSHVFDGCQDYTNSCYGSSEWYRNYMAVTGACMMIPRDVFESMNGFNILYKLGYSDIEFCLRAIEAGYQIIYTPFASLLHHEGGTRGLEQPLSDILRATLQMLPVIQSGDPFFNPNISYLSRKPLPACEPDDIREKHLEHILRHFELIATKGTENTFFKHFYKRFEPSAWPLLPIDTPPSSTTSRPGKRLLLISHDFSQSGAPLVLQQLAEYLRNQGYRLRVLSPVEGPLYQQYLDSGIETQIAPDLLDDARIIAEHAMEHDLVLANTILSWRAVHAASAMGKPCLWWLHEGEAGQSLARFNDRVQSTFPVAEKVIFPAHNTAGLYKSFTSGDNFVTAYIGVQIANTNNDIPLIDVEGSKFRILSTGSLEPRKGQDILLKALAAIPESIRENLDCYLIGRSLDPQFHSRLERIARQKNLHQVHMIGKVAPDEVWSYLQTADVFVLPSRNEVLPSSVLEAMAMGKAVVATRVGGIPEILSDGETGILFPPEDPIALADILMRLYHNQDLV